MNEYRSRKERERDIYVHSVYNAIGVYRVQFSLMFYICNIDARQRIVSINFSLSLSKSSSVINAYDRCRSNSSTINNFFLFFFVCISMDEERCTTFDICLTIHHR